MAVTPEYSRNMSFVGHSDQGGRADGVQVMVYHDHAYVGHMFSRGFSVVDVSDPRDPKPVNYVAAPPGTWSLHLQAHDDLLLVVNAADQFANPAFADERNYYFQSIGDVLREQNAEFTAGMRVFDISSPAEPREIGFMPVEGVGLHRIWYVGGRYAYVSALLDGFTDFIFVVIDMQDPTSPEIVGKHWLPGMWRAGGEEPTWPMGKRYALHHGVVADNIAHASWRDGGFSLIDVSDPTNPTQLAYRNWDPPYHGGTHSALPLVDRGLCVVGDEGIADNCEDGVKQVWMVDVREKTNPVNISTFPHPDEEDYCAKGAHYGFHNFHENRPGTFQSDELVFATYQNAGIRAFDIRNQFRPEEVACWVPPPPEQMFDTRPNRPQVIQSCDVFADTEGLLYVTDYNAGLYILQYEGT